MAQQRVAKGTPIAPGRPGSEWLQDLAARDWPAAGLPRFADWDPALHDAVRLIAQAPGPMALMIGRRGILAANPAVHALFAGKVGPRIDGRSVLEVLPDSAAFYDAVLERVLGGRRAGFRDQPMRLVQHGHAATSWFDLDFAPVVGEGGAALAVLGVATDVTRHVQRIRALSDSEERLRLALEGSGMVGIWTLDIRRRTSIADANVARMYGLPPEACREGVDHARFVEAVHADDRARMSETLRQAVATATPYRCRYRVLSHGGVRWVVAQAKPALDEDGAIGRMLGVVIDVTDQVETASALAESRFQFQTLTETLPQIVWSSDGEGRHDYFSARWSEFTGIALEDVTADTWKRLVYPEHWPMVSRAWDDARRTGEPYDIEYRFRHRSGEYRWLRVMARPMRDAAGRIVRWFGTSTDVHEAYLVAQERERLARELERLATEDPLTRVLTRRAFMDRARACFEAGPSAGMGVLMLDVDHFKAINDGYGHAGGDRVLAAVAGRMREALRQADLLGRLGGEEFGILLVDCTPRQARQAAERIRRAIGKRPVALDDGQPIAVTASLGVAAGPAADHGLERFLLAADKALYRAKSAGRDRAAFQTP